LLLGVAAVCAFALLVTHVPLGSSSSPRQIARSGGSAAFMPSGLAVAASASIGATEREFWLARRGGLLVARGGGIASSFAAAGARLRVAGGTVDLSLAGIGRGRRLARVAAAAPVARADEALYRDGSVRGFYRNGPFGVEQGFTVARRPDGGAGRLVLGLRVEGSLTAGQAGSQVLFKTAAGAVALRYGQLSAADATGRRLPAAMRLTGGVLRLEVNDRGARYPLRIDPFIEQAPKLTGGAEETKFANFGHSVALSADGNTALVGAPEDHAGAGAVWVFARSGSTWTQQGPKLLGAGEVGPGQFGSSVALSGSGYTALVGGDEDNGGGGAVWAFTRTGSTWKKQGTKLTGGEESGKALFGDHVALSGGAGDTALVGGPGDDGGVGAAWVFTRTETTWSQQGAKLTGGEEVGDGLFGSGVALSSDGNTALIGAPGDNSEVGAAWTFARSGSTWSQQGAKLTASGEGPHGEFGFSVALSGEASTALVGAPAEGEEGGVWVYTRSGSSWSQQPKLAPLGKVEKVGNADGGFGYTVALSADGETALVSYPGDNYGAGAGFVFTHTGSGWVQDAAKLIGAGRVGRQGTRNQGNVGISAALAGDASDVLLGGEVDNDNAGAAWAFEDTRGHTDSWTNTAGGSWFDGEDWSKGVPPGPEEEACVTAAGTYTVTMQQTSATGTVAVRSLTVGGASGTQTLVVASGCPNMALVKSADGIFNGWNGAVVMTNGEACSERVTLVGTFTNSGKLYVEQAAGGTRAIEGDLFDSGTVLLGAGTELKVAGGYDQTPAGRLQTSVNHAYAYGSLAAQGGYVLAGTLVVHRIPPLKGSFNLELLAGPESGQGDIPVGAFTTVLGSQLGYFPTYYIWPEYVNFDTRKATVRLVSHEVTATLAPKTDAPGETVSVTGDGCVAGDTITPTFTDHAGVKTSFPGVTVASDGAFSATIAVPAGAASGAATVTLQSAETGVKVKRTFAVT
jgi:hypothetical protein